MEKCNERAAKRSHFPLFFDLRGKQVVFIGGGAIAERRVRVLAEFAGQKTVIAPALTEGLEALAAAGEITAVRRVYAAGDLEGADLVFACTDSTETNEAVVRDARAAGIPVNDCENRELCGFYFPGVVTEGDVVVGMTASGKDHKKAKEVREEIAELLKKRSGAAE